MPALQLPTPDAIDAAASSLSVTATPAEQRALIKAQYHLHCGLEVVAVRGGLLIPSARTGDVYQVASDGSCNCPATGICWHQMTERIIIEAQSRPTMPKLAQRISAARAKQDMDALFS